MIMFVCVERHEMNPIFHQNPDAQHVHMSSNLTNVTRRCLQLTCHKMAQKKKRSNQTSRWRKKRRKFGRFPSFAKVKLQSLWRHPGMASVPSVPATVFFFLQSNQNRMVPIFFCLNKGVSLHMYVNYSTILSGMEKNSAKTQVSKCVNFLCVFFDMFWNRDENLNGMEKNIPSMFWSKRSWGKNTKDLGAQVGLSVVKRRPPLRRKRRGMKVLFIVFFVGGWRC